MIKSATMPPHCPKCAARELSELPSAAGSGTWRCLGCSGLWVLPSALNIQSALEALDAQDQPPPAPRVEDQRTGQCPDGHGLLRRARVTFHDPYFLERCSRCGGVWFDAGEWTRLRADQLVANLPELWSPAWRRHLSEEQAHESLDSDLRNKLGAELFELLRSLGQRLETHEHRGVALAYLRERWRHHTDADETH